MKGKILIIDDDNLVGISLKKALSKLNYEVDLCIDGNEAIDKVEQFNPDVILLDIYLTTHNGLDLLNDFQKKNIYCTCNNDYGVQRCKNCSKRN